MTLKVNEIFCSIQGEGLDQGRPCVMIRLTGCNLRCSYCDTRYSFEEGFACDIDSILEKTDSFGVKLVEITGGEPLLQENTPFLIKKLIEKGCKTLIETNGSFDIDLVEKKCVKIMDIKTPSSKMEKFNLYSNLEKLENEDQLKFVVQDKNDFLFALDVIKSVSLKIKPENIIFSPVFNKTDLRELASWVINEKPDSRMQIQMHKVIWPESMRGV
ncbi:MAG: 7-carboxy-7-deazaguanine synthase QueE [Desulfobacteraceae bacterium]|jgi:7-carboxy-7-deazaguanine synthase